MRLTMDKQGERMRLKHVGLVCSSEENCDRFYGKLLGLEKIGSKTVTPDMARQIFNLDFEYKIVNYASDTLHFEIFIDEHKAYDDRRIDHICLEFENLEAFLNTCRKLNVTLSEIPRGDVMLRFARDFDGNLFELKERKL